MICNVVLFDEIDFVSLKIEEIYCQALNSNTIGISFDSHEYVLILNLYFYKMCNE